jgi:hypothetical protein
VGTAGPPGVGPNDVYVQGGAYRLWAIKQQASETWAGPRVRSRNPTFTNLGYITVAGISVPDHDLQTPTLRSFSAGRAFCIQWPIRPAPSHTGFVLARPLELQITG